MCFNNSIGYGGWGNIQEDEYMESLSLNEQKSRIKELYHEDPIKYTEWKERCIRLGNFPELFGTIYNPIPIDESEL